MCQARVGADGIEAPEASQVAQILKQRTPSLVCLALFRKEIPFFFPPLLFPLFLDKLQGMGSNAQLGWLYKPENSSFPSPAFPSLPARRARCSTDGNIQARQLKNAPFGVARLLGLRTALADLPV